MVISFWLFVVCCAILYITSRLYPQEHTAESERLVWKNPLAALRRPGWAGLANYKFVSAALLIIMALLYLFFQLA